MQIHLNQSVLFVHNYWYVGKMMFLFTQNKPLCHCVSFRELLQMVPFEWKRLKDTAICTDRCRRMDMLKCKLGHSLIVSNQKQPFQSTNHPTKNFHSSYQAVKSTTRSAKVLTAERSQTCFQSVPKRDNGWWCNDIVRHWIPAINQQNGTARIATSCTLQPQRRCATEPAYSKLAAAHARAHGFWPAAIQP